MCANYTLLTRQGSGVLMILLGAAWLLLMVWFGSSDLIALLIGVILIVLGFILVLPGGGPWRPGEA